MRSSLFYSVRVRVLVDIVLIAIMNKIFESNLSDFFCFFSVFFFFFCLALNLDGWLAGEHSAFEIVANLAHTIIHTHTHTLTHHTFYLHSFRDSIVHRMDFCFGVFFRVFMFSSLWLKPLTRNRL